MKFSPDELVMFTKRSQGRAKLSAYWYWSWAPVFPAETQVNGVARGILLVHSYTVTEYLSVVFLPSLGSILCLKEGKSDFGRGTWKCTYFL